MPMQVWVFIEASVDDLDGEGSLIQYFINNDLQSSEILQGQFIADDIINTCVVGAEQTPTGEYTHNCHGYIATIDIFFSGHNPDVSAMYASTGCSSGCASIGIDEFIDNEGDV
jgi:hypothetical protein